MSPPLTLGLTGRIVATLRRAPLIFNIQDVFPDAAIETGAITNRRIIAAARWLERISYRSADAVTVLSTDLADNVKAKLPSARHDRVHEIPNFVDTEAIVPADRNTDYRHELGLGDGARRALRRQRRVLAVAGPVDRRGPAAPRRPVPRQR